MKSFLHQAAEYIYHKYPENISQICVVLPTRRASIYFKNALAQVATEGIWSPEVSSMEDFICRLAKVEVLEPIQLQHDLFDIIQNLDPHIDFDQFVTWASTLLEDFSRMDQEVVDTKKLFEYVIEAKALERWDPLQDKKVIVLFYSNNLYFQKVLLVPALLRKKHTSISLNTFLSHKLIAVLDN